MLTKYDKLVEPTHQEVERHKNSILLPTLIDLVEKEWGNTKKVYIARKLWLKSIESRDT
ncbi:hypothetical protein MXB_3530 [Myxobolus squamalis]|nr:hypothetical protein MXB_3530 [Myxobolus squamalis]